MKKIAADNNYRMFKRAELSDEERDHYGEVKSKLVELSQLANERGSDTAFYVFEAIRNTSLIHSVCRDDQNKYKNICMPHLGGKGTLHALDLTQEVMTGDMNNPTWAKYEGILFREIRSLYPSIAFSIIGWITVNRQPE